MTMLIYIICLGVGLVFTLISAFLGHVFGIATSRHWNLTVDHYLKESFEAKKEFFRRIRLVTYFNDVDLTLSIIDDFHRP